MSLNEHEQFIWVEKYRPHTIEDCILPKSIKESFRSIVDSGEVPNLILSGGPGCGKTTVARAICDQLELDYIMINGSMDGNIDTLRTTIKQFASTVSFSNKRKVVILDEADYLNPQSTQPALRGFIEEFAGNCSFIMTCNFKNRIIPALHSRCAVVEFGVPKDEKKEIISLFYKTIAHILREEDVSFDKNTILLAIVKYFPDYRKLINELQRYYNSVSEIDEDFLKKSLDLDVDSLFLALKNKDFKLARQWVVDNLDNDTATMYRKIYDGLYDRLQPSSIPQAVILLADYQYKNSFSADAEVCMLACVIELMVQCEFK
jgi:DNA polymerase III delta prime subunit